MTNNKCRIDTVISPDDGHTVARKNVQKRNKHTNKNRATSRLYLYDYFGVKNFFIFPIL